MQIALIQMPVTADKQENLRTARRCLEEAAAHNVDLAVLPEMFCCPYENAASAPTGNRRAALPRKLCARLPQIWGSMW